MNVISEGSRSRARMRRFYDEVWTRYIPQLEYCYRHREQIFPDRLLRGRRVLDAGCGTGVFARALAEAGSNEVIAVDFSRGALSTAQLMTSGAPVRLMCSSLEHLPFTGCAFDVIWAWGSVEHTDNPWGVLNELDRLCAPGGRILLALYKRTRWTPFLSIIRSVLSRLPFCVHAPASKAAAFLLNPLIERFKRREKMRGGETLQALCHDWFFVPARFHFKPEDVRAWLTLRGYSEELFIPATARFESSSHFVIRARKTEAMPAETLNP